MRSLRIYASTPARRTRQVVGDLLLVAWIVVAYRLSRTVHDATERLGVPGDRLHSAGGSLAERLRSAGDSLGSVPLVGDSVRAPFDGAGDAADQLAAAGSYQVHAVDRLAFWLGLSVLVIPVLLALALYLPPRVRFVRRATASQRFVDSAADLDLFALRALSHQPLHVLARISSDPAGAWRQRDADVVDRLASLELREAGLSPARALRRPPGSAATRRPPR